MQNAKDRNSSAKPEKVVQLYDQWVQLLGEVERLRAERNANAKSMKVCKISSRPHLLLYLLIACGMQTELVLAQVIVDVSARTELITQGKQLKEQLSHLELDLDDKEAELQQEAQRLPNLTHPQV